MGLSVVVDRLEKACTRIESLLAEMLEQKELLVEQRDLMEELKIELVEMKAVLIEIRNGG